jgi:hypothetical protein
MNREERRQGVRRAPSASHVGRMHRHTGACPWCGSTDPEVFTYMRLDELATHAHSVGQPFDVGSALAESLSRGLIEVGGQPVWWWCHACLHGGSMVTS